MQGKKVNPYQKCPVYETNRFFFRLVRETDDEDLLECYSDQISKKFFNSDNCTSDFVYNTLEEMQSCIRFWLDEYKKHYYVRFSVVDKIMEKAIGTIEFFAKDELYSVYGIIGILRIDLVSTYEKEDMIKEILGMVDDNLYDDFGVDSILTKAIPEDKQRLVALKVMGYSLAKEKILPFDFYYIKTR